MKKVIFGKKGKIVDCAQYYSGNWTRELEKLNFPKESAKCSAGSFYTAVKVRAIR